MNLKEIQNLMSHKEVALADSQALLVGITEKYNYENGVKLDTIKGYCYQSIFPECNYKRIDITVKSPSPLIPKSDWESKLQQGVPISIKELSVRMYKDFNGVQRVYFSAQSVSLMGGDKL